MCGRLWKKLLTNTAKQSFYLWIQARCSQSQWQIANIYGIRLDIVNDLHAMLPMCRFSTQLNSWIEKKLTAYA